MFSPIKKLYAISQVRELDRIAIEKFKIPGFNLMKSAGEVSFRALQNYFPNAKSIIVVCGKGNNAGDGFIVATLAKQAGLTVSVLTIDKHPEYKGDALLAYQDCQKQKVTVRHYEEYNDKAIQKTNLQNADLIVDAIFGSGYKSDIKEPYRSIILAINQSQIPVLAIDIPSGFNADTGNVLDISIKAKVTVTFVGAKKGLFTAEAKDYCGEVIFSDLGIQAEVFSKVSSNIELLFLEQAQKFLPKRKRTAHKGDFGHVLVIGGDLGMGGAVRMAGEAGLRSGAGLVTIASQPEHIISTITERPELMTHGINTGKDLLPLINKTNALVIGPGLGKSAWGKDLWQYLFNSKSATPKIIDADALNLLAENPQKNDNWILTPHPGEAARLLQCTTKDIQHDRFSAVQSIQKKYGGICILKGAGSIIFDGNQIWICPYGNPGMAKAGMGDVLSGILGGLVAQALSLSNAACLGTILHSYAADLAIKDINERSLLATDIFPYLQKLL